MQNVQKHYKVVLSGATKVGKTSLFNKYIEGQQNPATQPYQQTTTISHRSKHLNIQDQAINLEILDTPGSSEYETLRQSTYKGAQTIVFVFDVSDQHGVEVIGEEIEAIAKFQLCSYDCSAIVVGIVSNEKKPRNVTLEDTQIMGNIIGEYIEIDLSNPEKINQLFTHIAEQRLKFDKEDPTVKSLYENLHQNLEIPPFSQLKEVFLNQKKTFESQTNPAQNAAPSLVQIVPPGPIVISYVLVGYGGVGKSAMCQHYVDKKFPQIYHSTIGMDFKTQCKELDGTTYKLQIWDAAGMEKFQAMIQYYYQAKKIAFFVYNMTDLKSFKYLEQKISDFKNNNEEKVRYLCLVGNKKDLKREVSSEMGMELAQKHQMDFVEISAKNEQDLEDLFMRGLKYMHEHKVVK